MPDSNERTDVNRNKKKDDPELLGRWLSARREWDERYGDLITRAKNWRAMAFASTIFSMMCLGALIWQMGRSHVVPFVIAVNDLGRVIASGTAEQASVADPRVIRAAIIDWVENARTVSSDDVAQRRMVDRVYTFIAAQSAAQKFMNDFYSGDSPFERGRTQTVSVDVHSFTPVSTDSYEVDWQETTRDQSGTVAAKQEWKGVFTILLSPPKDETAARQNPLGIYIKAVTWSKIL